MVVIIKSRWTSHHEIIEISEIYFHIILEVINMKLGRWYDYMVSYSSDKVPFLFSLSVVPDVLWLVATSFSSLLSPYMAFCVWGGHSCSIPNKTLTFEFRAHPDNPGWFLLEMLDSITSSKNSFANNFTLVGSGCQYIDISFFFNGIPFNSCKLR